MHMSRFAFQCACPLDDLFLFLKIPDPTTTLLAEKQVLVSLTLVESIVITLDHGR